MRVDAASKRLCVFNTWEDTLAEPKHQLALASWPVISHGVRRLAFR